MDIGRRYHQLYLLQAMNLLASAQPSSESLSEMKDPFTSDCIETICFRIGKGWLDRRVGYSATVEFRNHNTKGEQRFTADDFPSLFKKVEEFTRSLPNQKP